MQSPRCQREARGSARPRDVARHPPRLPARLKQLPDGPERRRQELALETALGPPLMDTKGYAAPEVEQVYARARELCREVGETPQLAPVLWGLRI